MIAFVADVALQLVDLEIIDALAPWLLVIMIVLALAIGAIAVRIVRFERASSQVAADDPYFFPIGEAPVLPHQLISAGGVPPPAAERERRPRNIPPVVGRRSHLFERRAPMTESVRRIVGPTILLASGNYFDFEAPERSEFTIEDIAHALAMTCRFAGQCSRHYSVAQHSIHVSHFVPSAHAYQGLMHDAAEFAVGDMAKPLKVLCPEYGVIEKRVEAVVLQRFGIVLPLALTIKDADGRMLATEQRQLMNNSDRWHYTFGKAPYDFEIPTWTPEEAKERFLARYRELGGRP